MLLSAGTGWFGSLGQHLPFRVPTAYLLDWPQVILAMLGLLGYSLA